MRLLLLLSALLAALSGVGGTRATAQPVQASAAAMVATPRSAAASPVAFRFTVPAFATVPPLKLGLRPALGAVATRILYAERRRE